MKPVVGDAPFPRRVAQDASFVDSTNAGDGGALKTRAVAAAARPSSAVVAGQRLRPAPGGHVTCASRDGPVGVLPRRGVNRRRGGRAAASAASASPACSGPAGAAPPRAQRPLEVTPAAFRPAYRAPRAAAGAGRRRGRPNRWPGRGCGCRPCGPRQVGGAGRGRPSRSALRASLGQGPARSRPKVGSDPGMWALPPRLSSALGSGQAGGRGSRRERRAQGCQRGVPVEVLPPTGREAVGKSALASPSSRICEMQAWTR